MWLTKINVCTTSEQKCSKLVMFLATEILQIVHCISMQRVFSPLWKHSKFVYAYLTHFELKVEYLFCSLNVLFFCYDSVEATSYAQKQKVAAGCSDWTDSERVSESLEWTPIGGNNVLIRIAYSFDTNVLIRIKSRIVLISINVLIRITYIFDKDGIAYSYDVNSISLIHNFVLDILWLFSLPNKSLNSENFYRRCYSSLTEVKLAWAERMLFLTLKSFKRIKKQSIALLTSPVLNKLFASNFSLHREQQVLSRRYFQLPCTVCCRLSDWYERYVDQRVSSESQGHCESTYWTATAGHHVADADWSAGEHQHANCKGTVLMYSSIHFFDLIISTSLSM